MGVCVDRTNVQNKNVQLDGSFEKCPIAWALGIPLMVKRLPGWLSQQESTGMELIVRMMGDPDSGLAPFDWQYGWINGPAPPVLLERSDEHEFTTDEWCILDDFICGYYSECPSRRVNRKDFTSFVKGCASLAHINHQRANGFLDVWEHLELRYPEGSHVKATGLSSEAGRLLNGKIGVINGRYEYGRIGILFPEPFGVKALKPRNINPAQKFQFWSFVILYLYLFNKKLLINKKTALQYFLSFKNLSLLLTNHVCCSLKNCAVVFLYLLVF